MQICIALGIGAGCYWLVWLGTSTDRVTKFGSFSWMLFVIPPLCVGARPLYLLTIRKPPEVE